MYSTAQALHCEQVQFANTGKMYWNVPVQFFVHIMWINLNRTATSSNDFLKFVSVARHLDALSIESCRRMSVQAIFKTKESLHSLKNINASFNKQFSVLTIACFSSFDLVQDIHARGLNFESKELFFNILFPKLHMETSLWTLVQLKENILLTY